MKKNVKLVLFVVAFWLPTIACAKMDASGDDVSSLSVPDISVASTESFESREELTDSSLDLTTEIARESTTAERNTRKRGSVIETTARETLPESTESDSDIESTIYVPDDTDPQAPSTENPPTTTAADPTAIDSSEPPTLPPAIEQPTLPPPVTETEPIPESPTQPTVIQTTEYPTEPPVETSTNPPAATEPPAETTTEPKTEPSTVEITTPEETTTESQPETTIEETTSTASLKEHAEALLDEIVAYATEHGWVVIDIQGYRYSSWSYSIFLKLYYPECSLDSVVVKAFIKDNIIETIILRKDSDDIPHDPDSSYTTMISIDELYEDLLVNDAEFTN